MRAARTAEHAAVLLLGLSAGLGLDGGLRPWTVPLGVLVVAAATVAGRFRPIPGAGRIRAVAVLPGAVLVAAVATVNPWEAVSAVVVAALVAVLPFALARARRQQIELLAAERSRSAALLAERAAVAEGARLSERSRLAADIHHTLGHELALLGVRAGALEMTCDDPAQRQAAAAVRASAAAATDHLRHALDLLEPATAATTVDDIVDRARRAGLDVGLARHGERPVPDALARLVEHTVREGIANAARHAPGARIGVSCSTGTPGVVLRITNGPGSAAGEPGTGRGLAQLAEQSRSLGADLHAGPDGDGWVLELRASA